MLVFACSNWCLCACSLWHTVVHCRVTASRLWSRGAGRGDGHGGAALHGGAQEPFLLTLPARQVRAADTARPVARPALCPGVCVCVCARARVQAFKHAHMQAPTYACSRTCRHAHMQARVHASIRTCMHTHTHALHLLDLLAGKAAMMPRHQTVARVRMAFDCLCLCLCLCLCPCLCVHVPPSWASRRRPPPEDRVGGGEAALGACLTQ